MDMRLLIRRLLGGITNPNSIIKGFYRSFINREFSRLFTPTRMEHLFQKASRISDTCLSKGHCQKCGCYIKELIFSDKDCSCRSFMVYIRYSKGISSQLYISSISSLLSTINALDFSKIKELRIDEHYS